MTRTKGFFTMAVLLVFVSVFGAWTGAEAETRYADVTLVTPYANEVINFTHREIDGPITTPGECPYYHPLSDLTNACGAVAGAEIVAYYDKYYPNLILNWQSYLPSSGKYLFQDSTYVPVLMRDLYTRMRTNIDGVGVSKSDFLTGLRSYINCMGHQVSYRSVRNVTTINFDSCKDAIDNNKVIVLFALPTTVYTVSLGTDRDAIIPTTISGAHVMVAFGYYEINYYNDSGLFRTDRYLAVAMGQTGYTFEFYKVDCADTDAAFVVDIQ